MAGNLMMDGSEVDHGPRNVLRRMVGRAGDQGMRFRTGVECEFHLINADGSDIHDSRDIMDKPCYDQQALMRPL